MAAGEVGHRLFEHVGWEAGHHAFHLAYGVGALLAFLRSVIRDVRRHGLPSFRWSLRAEEDVRRAPG